MERSFSLTFESIKHKGAGNGHFSECTAVAAFTIGEQIFQSITNTKDQLHKYGANINMVGGVNKTLKLEEEKRSKLLTPWTTTGSDIEPSMHTAVTILTLTFKLT